MSVIFRVGTRKIIVKIYVVECCPGVKNCETEVEHFKHTGSMKRTTAEFNYLASVDDK